jgi:hypothetical protein
MTAEQEKRNENGRAFHSAHEILRCGRSAAPMPIERAPVSAQLSIAPPPFRPDTGQKVSGPDS